MAVSWDGLLPSSAAGSEQERPELAAGPEARAQAQGKDTLTGTAQSQGKRPHVRPELLAGPAQTRFQSSVFLLASFATTYGKIFN